MKWILKWMQGCTLRESCKYYAIKIIHIYAYIDIYFHYQMHIFKKIIEKLDK